MEFQILSLLDRIHKAERALLCREWARKIVTEMGIATAGHRGTDVLAQRAWSISCDRFATDTWRKNNPERALLCREWARKIVTEVGITTACHRGTDMLAQRAW